MQLLGQSLGKFLCVSWNLCIKTYPKFVTLRSFFKIFKNISKTQKKIEIIKTDFKKLINLFEIKRIGHVIIYGALFFAICL